VPHYCYDIIFITLVPSLLDRVSRCTLCSSNHIIDVERYTVVVPRILRAFLLAISPRAPPQILPESSPTPQSVPPVGRDDPAARRRYPPTRRTIRSLVKNRVRVWRDKSRPLPDSSPTTSDLRRSTVNYAVHALKPIAGNCIKIILLVITARVVYNATPDQYHAMLPTPAALKYYTFRV